MSPDEQLVQRAKAGDVWAFEQLAEMNQRRMYALAYRLVGNSEDAMDVVQEALVRLYKSIKNFEGQSSFWTWTYRVVTNLCLDEMRKRKNRQAVSLDALEEDGMPQPKALERPDDMLVQKERYDAVMQLMEQLPEDLRVALMLRDVQGLAYEEIAGVLAINLGTVKSRISRAREKMRERLCSQELFADKRV